MYQKLTLCLAAILIACGCTPPPPSAAIRPVRAVKVGDMKVVEGRWYPGRAEAVDEVDLSFRVSGPLTALPIKVGDRVKKGDPLAIIDPTDYQSALDLAKGNLERSKAQLLAMERGARPEEIEQLKASVAEAKATAAQAQAEFERYAKLLPSRNVTQSEYDVAVARRDRTAAQVKIAEENLRIGQEGARAEDKQAKRAEIQALQAAVADAENKLNYTRLLAPFDGDVAAKYVENYQTIQAKQPIARLLNSAKIKVVVQVPESAISLVPLVKDVTCQFDALPGKDIVGRITEVGTEASRTTRTYPITVEIDQPADGKVHPGMAGKVRGNLKESAAGSEVDVVVPADAVFSPDTEKQSFVLVYDEGTKTVSRRGVKTGELTSGGIKILEGVKKGEWVVTAGVHSLQDGQEVKLMDDGGSAKGGDDT